MYFSVDLIVKVHRKQGNTRIPFLLEGINQSRATNWNINCQGNDCDIVR